MSENPEQLIGRDNTGKPWVSASNYKQDAQTGRYIIPYTLADTIAPHDGKYGKVTIMDDEQKRAVFEIMGELQQAFNIQYKDIATVRPEEKGTTLLQINQGDIQNLFWADDLQVPMGPHIGGIVVTTDNNDAVIKKRQTLIIDNDWRTQLAADARPNYWKKGGEGYRKIRHEMLHTLGLTDSYKVNLLLTEDTTDMAYIPGIKTLAGLKKPGLLDMDIKAVVKIFGPAPDAAANAPASVIPEEKTRIQKPFSNEPPVIAAGTLGITALLAAVLSGARAIKAIVFTVAAAVIGAIGMRYMQKYNRAVEAAENVNNPPKADTTPVAAAHLYESLPNPLPLEVAHLSRSNAKRI